MLVYLERIALLCRVFLLPVYWESISFNDRIRDAILGGSPFGHPLQQGFVTGLLLQVYKDYFKFNFGFLLTCAKLHAYTLYACMNRVGDSRRG